MSPARCCCNTVKDILRLCTWKIPVTCVGLGIEAIRMTYVLVQFNLFKIVGVFTVVCDNELKMDFLVFIEESLKIPMTGQADTKSCHVFLIPGVKVTGTADVESTTGYVIEYVTSRSMRYSHSRSSYGIERGMSPALCLQHDRRHHFAV